MKVISNFKKNYEENNSCFNIVPIRSSNISNALRCLYS